jgi:high-affinity K+ transport system ATPase subunit B
MTDVTPGLSVLDNIAAKIPSGEAGQGKNALDLGSLLGHMSMTIIFINLVAGLVGTAYFMYGKKRCDVKLLCCGVALCVVPFFISNTILLIVACLAMAAAPFVI